MDKEFIFEFKTDITGVGVPEVLNNPFGKIIPEIAKIAASNFQEFMTVESLKWEHDFSVQKGKMFGVLVVQKKDNSYGYLATVSGKLFGNTTCYKFTPSVFDDSIDDFYINKGMIELTKIGNDIKRSLNPSEIIELSQIRTEKSFALQQWLFKQYQFLNIYGHSKNVLEIFKNSSQGNPPAAAGECAAPKLLQYAFKHQLKPIALAEFWWGKPPKNKEKVQGVFYPACKNKCRPILEYMLGNNELFNQDSKIA